MSETKTLDGNITSNASSERPKRPIRKMRLENLFYPGETVSVFIESYTLHKMGVFHDETLDLSGFLALLRSYDVNVKQNFFYALYDESNTEFSSFKKTLDFASYNGFDTVVKRPTKFTNDEGREITRGSVGMEMTIDIMKVAKSVDHVVVVTSNPDFAALFYEINRMGVKTTLVGSIERGTNNDLRKSVGNFIEYADLVTEINKMPPNY